MPHCHTAVRHTASNKYSQLWLLFGTKRIFSITALLRITSAKCFLDEFCTCIQSQISVQAATQSQPKLKYKLPGPSQTLQLWWSFFAHWLTSIHFSSRCFNAFMHLRKVSAEQKDTNFSSPLSSSIPNADDILCLETVSEILMDPATQKW